MDRFFARFWLIVGGHRSNSFSCFSHLFSIARKCLLTEARSGILLLPACSAPVLICQIFQARTRLTEGAVILSDRMVMKTRRQLWIWSGILAAGLVLLVGSMPLWFPWVLPLAASRLGLNYQGYERSGLQRFKLHGLRYSHRSVAFKSQSVEAYVPIAWVWHKFVGRDTNAYVQAVGWELVVDHTSREEAPASKPVQSVPEISRAVARTLAPLRDWLPRATLSHGVIQTGEMTLEVPQAAWQNGALTAEVALPKVKQRARLRAELGAPPWQAALQSDTLSLDGHLRVWPASGQLRATATAEWLTNTFQTTAAWGPQGLLPQTATLRAESFAVPAELLSLKGYEDLRGSAFIDWRVDRFQLRLSGQANPEHDPRFPPVVFHLQASGNTNRAIIEVAEASVPGLELKLSESVAVSRTRPYLEDPAKARLRVELDKQPWFDFGGVLEGEVKVQPGAGYPTASFSISGSGLSHPEGHIPALQVKGRFEFPWLEVRSLEAELGDGSRAAAQARLDVQKRLVEDGTVRYAGDRVGLWLPEGYACESVQLSGQFRGPLTNLTHSGQAALRQLQTPRLQPLSLETEWTGHHLALSTLSFAAHAGASSLSGAGALDLGSERQQLELTQLSLRTNSASVLELAQPVLLEVNRGSDSNRWSVLVQPLRWAGSNREVRLEANLVWPDRGVVQGTLRGISPSLWGDFLKDVAWIAQVDDLELDARWTNGPAHFQLGLDGTVMVTNDLPLRVQATILGGDEGTRVESLRVSSADQAVVAGSGHLPATFHPSDPQRPIHWLQEAPLRFDLATRPHDLFWKQVAPWIGWEVENPALQLAVDGSLAAPKGQVSAQVGVVRLGAGNGELPPVENLVLRAHLDREQLAVERLECQILEQLITLSATVSLGESFWANPRKQVTQVWRQASANLQIERADLAALAGYFPDVLAPQGELSANLTLRPGILLDGGVTIRDAATRPLPSLGPIREVNGEVRLDGRRLEVTRLTASLSGQPLRLTGRALLPEQWEVDALPPFDVRLSGTNLPLVRRPEMILRADFDLVVTNTPAQEAPAVTGVVTLQNSYLVSDLADLVPGKVARPSQRPPYFSIAAQPFGPWRLDVRVRGDDFMRVRSPLFRGKVSTALRLAGTLQDPTALGEVRIAPGSQVQFPFASFVVSEGLVSLTSENVYEPQLFVRATSERLGYELTMEMNGAASEPNLRFTASPPLSPEQILLMVTTGAAPRQAGQLTTGQRAQRMGLFLGRSVLSQLGFGGSGENRLTIQSGEQVTESGRATYDVEYKLTEDWSIIGQYDQFSDFNVGLKWRIYSR